MDGGDFEPEGWSAFDDHGGGVKGNAGCGCAMIAIVIIAIVVALCGGCTKEDEAAFRDPFEGDDEITVSSNTVGRIDWDDPGMKLWYRECGAPFSPIEMLIVEARGRHLYCKCFKDADAETANKPYLILYHDCDEKEWAKVLEILKASGMEGWRTRYDRLGVCDGTFWHVKVASGTNVLARTSGSNAWPESFGKFFVLKKLAMNHPERHVFRDRK